MNKKLSTIEQLNNLIEFRQVVYEHELTDYRDAQCELVDALLSNRRVWSFAELTLSPLFRRSWSSGYAAVEGGQQAEEWLTNRKRTPPRRFKTVKRGRKRAKSS